MTNRTPTKHRPGVWKKVWAKTAGSLWENLWVWWTVEKWFREDRRSKR